MSGKNDKNQNDIKNNTIDDIPPTFYDKIGDNIIMDLTKLSELVFQRYKILKAIENSTQKTKLNEPDVSVSVPYELINFDWNTNLNNDISSHFILALIMCKNETDMKWFIRHETNLYKTRIENKKDPQNPQKKKYKYNMYRILSLLGVKLEEYKSSNNEEINKICFRDKNSKNEKIYFCKFEDALNLVPTHDYYLNKGNIYIPESDLQNLFKLIFEQSLEKTINKIKIKSKNIANDRRIREIINSFENAKQNMLREEAEKLQKEMPNDEKLKTMNDIDIVSEKCFPLCMNLIERHINQYSHLTHFGRLQYTLFLKGAGLPVDEALKFFQKKYEKKTPLDKFEKEYAYNIRHSYGLEGKRVSYTPYTCEKIINMNGPMGRECHGCPFKTYSTDNLRKILNTCNLSPVDIEEIIIKKKNNEYQLACRKYFEGKFPKRTNEGEGIGIHPNRYFSSAMKIIKNENNKVKENENNYMDIDKEDIN